MLVKYKGKYYLSYTNNITDNVQKRKNALGRTNIRGIPRKVLSLELIACSWRETQNCRMFRYSPGGQRRTREVFYVSCRQSCTCCLCLLNARHICEIQS